MRKRSVIIGFAIAWMASTVLAATQWVSEQEIRIGASVVLTGPLGAQTFEYGEGSRLYFDAVNAAGGIHGRKIVYRTRDDGFDVNRAVENTKALLEQDQVFLIYNNTGTAHTAAILPLVAETKTVVFGPVTGASALRQTYHKHLFHVRAGYADEAARIVRQLHELGVQRVAALFQDDAFGKALLAEVRKAATARQLDLVAQVALDPKQPAFDAAAQASAKAAPQALIMCTAGSTFTGSLKALAATAARPVVYGFSVVSVDQVNKDLGPASRGIVLAQIVPSLANGANPAVSEYLALVRAKGGNAKPTTTQFEGFMHARVLVEGLKRAGRNLTTETLVQALESGGEIAFGKFAVRYTPQAHNGSSYVELAIIDADGRLRY